MLRGQSATDVVRRATCHPDATSSHRRGMISRPVYSAALRLATPLILGRLLWRSRRAPAYRRRWSERFGYIDAVPGAPIWLHAVSVGETLAAAPLVRGLLKRFPDIPLLITSTTPTGSERVRALFGERVHHCYAPYDTPGAVRRFFDRVRPRLGLIMETEIWPNMLAEADRRGIPTLLANARLSERSAAGYARVPRLSREALSHLTLLAVQDNADATRFRKLGAPAHRVRVTGSIKFDQTIPPEMEAEGRRLRERLGTARPVWAAASTHDGEEAAALQAHARLRQQRANAALILVPRHPERFDAVADAARRAGFSVARRTHGASADFSADVYLGDTMGELPMFLAAADVVFMGGSLVPVGGHNPLEPAGLAKPVLIGPHVFNFSQVVALLERAHALKRISDVDALATEVIELFEDADRRRGMGTAGRTVVDANRGACDRVLAAVAEYLPATSAVADSGEH
jgi:3-deoxy-D-manno-octulosonic-acid transferase